MIWGENILLHITCQVLLCTPYGILTGKTHGNDCFSTPFPVRMTIVSVGIVADVYGAAILIFIGLWKD